MWMKYVNVRVFVHVHVYVYVYVYTHIVKPAWLDYVLISNFVHILSPLHSFLTSLPASLRPSLPAFIHLFIRYPRVLEPRYESKCSAGSHWLHPCAASLLRLESHAARNIPKNHVVMQLHRIFAVVWIIAIMIYK